MQALNAKQYELLHQEYRLLLENASEWVPFLNDFRTDFSDPPLKAFMETNMVALNEFIHRNARKLSRTGTVNPLYLITFTHNNESEKSELRKSVLKQLHREIFIHSKFAEEHKDSNYHIHAICESKFHLAKSHFASHARKHGHVDVQLCLEDNGLDAYISKENPITIVK